MLISLWTLFSDAAVVVSDLLIGTGTVSSLTPGRTVTSITGLRTVVSLTGTRTVESV